MLDTLKMKPQLGTLMRGLSEFSATAILITISCMGCAVNEHKDQQDAIYPSLIHGLAVVIVMHIFGFISGAHANPCVSIACCLLRYISTQMALLYVASQLAGAAFGYFLLLQMLPQSMINSSKLGVCVVEPMKDLFHAQITCVEGFLTSVLIFAWCALWDVRSGRFLDSVTLRMGCLVTACHLVGGQLSGASLNPARLIIPAIFNGNPESILFQLIGQVVAAFVVPQIWQFVYTQRYRPLRVENGERRSPELYLTP